MLAFLVRISLRCNFDCNFIALYYRDSGVNATNVQRQNINKDGHDANKSMDAKGRGGKQEKYMIK